MEYLLVAIAFTAVGFYLRGHAPRPRTRASYLNPPSHNARVKKGMRP